MNASQFLAGFFLGLAIIVALLIIGDRIQEATEACNQPSLSDRHTIIDGQEVAYWVRDINGRYIVIFQCPGQAPEIAADLVGVRCE